MTAARPVAQLRGSPSGGPSPASQGGEDESFHPCGVAKIPQCFLPSSCLGSVSKAPRCCLPFPTPRRTLVSVCLPSSERRKTPERPLADLILLVKTKVSKD